MHQPATCGRMLKCSSQDNNASIKKYWIKTNETFILMHDIAWHCLWVSESTASFSPTPAIGYSHSNPKHMLCPEEDSCWLSIPQSPSTKYLTKRRTATAASVTPSSSAIAATSCGGLLWLITRPTWRPNINWVQLGACRQASVLPNISPLARGAMHIVAIPFFLGNPSFAGHKRTAAGCKTTYFDSPRSCDTQPGQAVASNLSAGSV